MLTNRPTFAHNDRNKARNSASLISEMRVVLRHTAVYGFGNVLGKVIGLLMLPLYTSYLTPVDYGLLEVLDLSMSLLGMFIAAGIIASLLNYYSSATDERSRQRVVSTAFLFTLGAGLLTLAIGLMLVPRVSSALLGPTVPHKYLYLSFVSFVFAYISTAPRTFLRALEASGAFVKVETAALLLNLTLNVVCVVFLNLGALGILWSSCLVAALQTLVLSAWMLRRVGVGFEAHTLGRLLSFGAPLMFANAGVFALNFSDRFFLQHLRSLEEVGIYAVGYKLAYMLNYMVIQPFCVMWQARMFIVYRNPDYPELFSRVGIWFALLMIYVALGLSVLSSEVTRLMIGRSFAGAQRIVPVVAFAYVLYGLGFYAQLGLFLARKTRVIGAIGAAAAVVNLIANYFLIERFGVMGAAWATVVGFALLAVASYLCSQAALPLPLPLIRILAALGLAMLTYLVAQLLTTTSPITTTMVKVGLLAVFPVVVWKASILPPHDAELVTASTERAIGRMRKVLLFG